MAILGQYALTLPADTSGNRPSASTAMVRVNTSNKTLEFYNGSQWIQTGFPGSSPQNPASSAVQIFNCGVRGKGFFWLSSPNGGTVLNYCDLDTLDQDGVAGWILVAQFPYSENWTSDGYTTRDTLNPLSLSMNENAQNDAYTRQWSANWGNYSINRFRIHNTDNVAKTGTNAQADWYYHWSTSILWKQVWSWADGNYNYMNDGSGDNNGNINASYHSGWPSPVNVGNATPRCCLRGFNWAYNIKFAYQHGSQRWASLSDGGGSGTAQQNCNFWAGLTSPNNVLRYNFASDGTLAIAPNGDGSTTAGHDCNSNNAKFGIDDGTSCAMWSSNSTNSTGQTGVTDYRRQLYFWIK